MDNLKFSQRIGQTPATKKLQIDSMDVDLRSGLWNQYRPILESILGKIYIQISPYFSVYTMPAFVMRFSFK